jgi:hypothetical protein
MRAKMQPRCLPQPHESQQGSQQSASQPQLGSAAQPQAGSQPQLGSAQPQAGSQHESQQACLAARRARSRANRPHRGAQQGSQHESQAISQPQLGSAAQPHAGSQPQPPMPKNALAFEAQASAMATPSVDSR